MRKAGFLFFIHHIGAYVFICTDMVSYDQLLHQ